MMKQRMIGLALLGLAGLAGCHVEEETELENPVKHEAGLERLTDCGSFRLYLAETTTEAIAEAYVGGWRNGWYEDDMDMDAEPSEDAGGDQSDGPTDFTTTNVQEEGVDEIDIVKTDGQYLYVVDQGSLFIVDSWPVEDSELVGQLDLGGHARGMFLNGDQVVVFSHVYDDDLNLGDYWYGATRISVVDVSDRANPQVSRTIDIGGYLADGRMIDGDIYAVSNHYSYVPSEAWNILDNHDDLPQVDWSLEGEELEANRLEVRAAVVEAIEDEVRQWASNLDLDQVLPVWSENGGDPERMVECEDLYRPANASRYNTLTVTHLDLDDGEVDTTGILSDGWTIYASQDNLYVAQANWWSWWYYWNPTEMSSVIHKFHLDPESEPEYVATGEVSGYLYDQFAMSEYDGHLRVATSDIDWWWWSETEEEEPGNNVFVLEDDGQGTLEQVGAVTGIAPGEQIYASRMMGDRGYIVTFEQIDPLWTLDLSDPTNPSIAGELELPGYSSYLHPVGEDHLLAVGMAGTMDGNLTGLAVNLFDVSDMSAPTLAAQHELSMNTEGWSWSEALWDHHAFTYHRDVLSIPAYSWDWDDDYDTYDYFSGIVSFDVSVEDASISEIGRVNHRDLIDESRCYWSEIYDWYEEAEDICHDYYWYASVRRSVYIEDNLFSISNYGVKVTDLNDPTDEIAEVLFYPAAQ